MVISIGFSHRVSVFFLLSLYCFSVTLDRQHVSTTKTHFLRRNPTFGLTICCCHTTKASQHDTSTVSDRLGTHSVGRAACFWMVVTDSSAHPRVIMSRTHSLPGLNTHHVYVCEHECECKYVLSISVVLFISDKNK